VVIHKKKGRKSKDSVDVVRLHVLDQILQIPQRVVIKKHRFVGKAACRRWIDCTGNIEELVGKVVKCERDLLTQELLFTIYYDEHFEHPQEFPRVQSDLSEKEVSNLISAFAGKENPEWICPRRINYQREEGRMNMVAKHCLLEFKVAKSNIPSAGKGLFIRCKKAHESMNQTFLLQEGERLDLGVYGPLSKEDIYPEHVSLTMPRCKDGCVSRKFFSGLYGEHIPTRRRE